MTRAETDDGARSGYEVEVQLPDGRRVEVELGRSFPVSGIDDDEHDDV